MKKYIALLRGINVSGQKKIKMADLKALFEAKGMQNVVTYIQSGNVVFEGNDEPIAFAKAIKAWILEAYGFEVPTLVKSAEDIARIMEDCPFHDEQKQQSYFTLMHTLPEQHLVDKITELSYPNEDFAIVKDAIYFYSPKGYGNAKCNNNFFERKLKVAATTRNYKTMMKLLEMTS